ncbi:MAG: ImmA/IrrE family metallo-endopeptidase [Anaerolineae bacterium]|nr:ImmA/IrrE family metallo-endopeptidase [Anaerolineae bacterium]
MEEHNDLDGKQPPTRQFLRQIEQHAMVIRQKAGVESSEKLDPIIRAAQLGIQVQYADQLSGLSEAQIEFIRNSDAKDWSGGADARKLPNGRLLITLHPNQTKERANVTILEEVAHDHYGHEPISLNGSRQGKYDERAEQEAYWTAAATLLPMKDVAQAIWLRKPAKVLAEEFGASIELVEMRIKILGFWRRYQEWREER